MGWFTTKDKPEERGEPTLDLPELPKLPELPDLDESPKQEKFQNPHRLPSFPSSPLGKKFSQNTIKNAVTGEKEVGGFDADDLALDDEEEMQMMPKPLKKPLIRGVVYEEPIMPRITQMKRAEPVFIRIDKFEESLNLFEKAKSQISEIEKMLTHIKKAKEEEEKELVFWESEMQKIKNQIQKVDQDIFSKV